MEIIKENIWGILFSAFLIGIILLGVSSMRWKMNADCEEFSNMTLKNLPARCFNFYAK